MECDEGQIVGCLFDKTLNKPLMSVLFTFVYPTGSVLLFIKSICLNLCVDINCLMCLLTVRNLCINSNQRVYNG